ncbi:unnamed protein product [Bursaphelenchus okinawaensis]|uniref:Protein kinase domain-containing protein n=1 Tax=Bursaphelenchus okinawaensis TaxID=465554 RepID=A0A811LFC8_9BILA|nr:unnamed protein product [Bursaphelenchus okinawaensis]CAG9121396.1 unnamed protein product [Bursaphelenchus okinawaensis]
MKSKDTVINIDFMEVKEEITGVPDVSDKKDKKELDGKDKKEKELKVDGKEKREKDVKSCDKKDVKSLDKKDRDVKSTDKKAKRGSKGKKDKKKSKSKEKDRSEGKDKSKGKKGKDKSEGKKRDDKSEEKKAKLHKEEEERTEKVKHNKDEIDSKYSDGKGSKYQEDDKESNYQKDKKEVHHIDDKELKHHEKEPKHHEKESNHHERESKNHSKHDKKKEESKHQKDEKEQKKDETKNKKEEVKKEEEPKKNEIANFKKGETMGTWIIEKKLGEGSFGAVFKVHGGDNVGYAMKVEKVTETLRVLKMEVYVLRDLKRLQTSKHFCELIDSGQIGQYNYMVMSLVGPSLSDLLKHPKDISERVFSLSTCVFCAVQCLEAIEELHSVGYLHRDIKPGNYAVGVNNTRHILLLDFGMARKYLNGSGDIRRPRWATGFRGTVRYAALSCHVSREQCRKDDLESWFYMLVEFTVGAVPWKAVEDKNEIGRIKEKSRLDGSLQMGCPIQYREIIAYIDSVRYYEEPDYEYLNNVLDNIMRSNLLNLAAIDWEKWLTTESESKVFQHSL